MDITTVLNKEQIEACQYLDGHLRIVAGAGSGKTRVLTYRIAYLIENIGINPRSILAITFTNKAANEMRHRVEQLLGSENTGVLLCTIHSLCVRILRQHIRVLNYPTSFVIMDEEDQKALMKNLYKEYHIDSKIISYNSALSAISTFKNSNITPEMALMQAGNLYGEKNKALLYGAYTKYQQEHFLLDFDDLILFAVKILSEYDDIRSYWQSRFQYIHVDEFQDVDYQNYRLVQLLTGPDTIVCVVGDPDQTIYSFRGASIRYIMDFEKSFENAKTIYLNRNYRSTKNILNAANTLISHNRDRLEKDLFTDNDGGTKIIHFCADSDEAEAQYVAEQIESTIANVEGLNYKDFAVLYRANYFSRQLEQEFINNKIPYRIFGGLKFFNRKEVKDILSYLRLIAVGDDLAFERIINVPARGIGEKTIEKIRQQAELFDCSLYDACAIHFQALSLSARVKKQIIQFVTLIENLKQERDLLKLYDRLLADSGYMEMLSQDQEEARIQNLMELKNSIASFLERNVEITLQDYLQEVALYTNQDVDDNGQYVSMMTIHMSKGLEFPYVFVIGLSENIFPSMRSLEESGDAGLEEERRLAYVAYTRAMQQLYLVESQGYSYVSHGPKSISRFISEVADEFLEHNGKSQRYVQKNYVMSRPTSSQKVYDVEMGDWKIGELVLHDVFGKGVVLKINGDTLQIAFPLPYGIKNLMAGHPALKKLAS